jgi:antitoxin (DNA-binding transcriptional repressor) of toxin-antitoxin stability system
VKTMKLSRASRPLTEYAAELRGEVLVLTQRSRPVAAVVPLKGVDRESLALSSHPEFLELIARSRAEIRRGQKLTLEEMKKVLAADPSPNKLRIRVARSRDTIRGWTKSAAPTSRTWGSKKRRSAPKRGR